MKTFMKILRNEKGFALGFVLILSVIGLLMTVAMMIMVSRGSYMSAQQRRFRSAVEASKSGVDSMFHYLDTRGTIDIPLAGLSMATSFGPKITQATSSWAGLDNTLTINPAVPATYDMQFAVGNYMVYLKVADTVEGNSAGSEGLIRAGVVNAGAGEVVVPSVPYLYTIEVLSQDRTNASERSRMSVLYQY